ncbi:hypothetical protein [Streptosporangium sp. NPDC051022]|uniref:hypothetical protein n=1 Tax=Streptosporangium sp. NPDC051022 TaxID=3155752 RepID=UPI00342678D4
MNLTGGEPSDDDVQRQFFEIVKRFYTPSGDLDDLAVPFDSPMETAVFQFVHLTIQELMVARSDLVIIDEHRPFPLALAQKASSAPLISDVARAGTANPMSRETKRRLLQAQVFIAVFAVITVAILEHEDAASMTTLFIGGSALQLAWYCAVVAGRTFDRLYPPEAEE